MIGRPGAAPPSVSRSASPMHEREFLRTLGGASLGAFLDAGLLARYAHVPPAETAPDHAFWTAVRGK